jgi:hypothetical protein
MNDVLEWRQAIGLSKYEISSNGDLRRNNKIILSEVSKFGYKRKYLKDFKINVLIHRLVAQAFIPNPENKPQVNHIDGNKQNNNLINLEWVTVSENQLHSYKIGLKKSIKGDMHGKSILTSIQISIIREAMKRNHKQQNIANYFGVHQSTISLIKSNKNWSC